jgi:HEAT repeat protein
MATSEVSAVTSENTGLFDGILADLNSRDVEQKVEAIAALGILRHPEHAGIIKDLLASPEEQVVDAALTALGSIGNPVSIKYIFEVLADPRPQLVEKAAGVLRQFADPDLLDGILKQTVVDHPPVVKRKLLNLISARKEPRVQAAMTDVLAQTQDTGLLQEALTYFIRFPSPERKALLETHSGSGQWEIAMAANVALSRLRDEGAMGRLKKQLKSPAHPLRLALIQALNVAPGIEDRPLYEALFHDPHPQIRILSIQGLHLFSADERREQLKAWLHREKDEAVRRALLTVIQEKQDVAFIDELLHLLSASSDDVKKWGRQALIALGDGIVPALVRRAATASLVLKEQLVIVFGALGHPEGLKFVFRCLETRERWLKINAIEALTRFGERRLLPKFIEMLASEEDVWIRATLLSAVGHLGSAEHLPVLKDNLQHQDARVRANAIDGLARLGDPQATTILERFLRDPNDRVRVNAAIGLWKLGNAEVVSQLVDMTRDSSKWMKASAAFALGEIRAFHAVPDLVELLATSEDVVYRNAFEALVKIGDPRALRPLMRERHRNRLPAEMFDHLFADFVQKLR